MEGGRLSQTKTPGGKPVVQVNLFPVGIRTVMKDEITLIFGCCL